MSKVCCVQYCVIMIGGDVDGSPVDFVGSAGESKQNVTFLCILNNFAPMIIFVYIGMLADISRCKGKLLKRIPCTLRVFYHIFIASMQFSPSLFQ
jgi:hypothetical protein